MLIQKYKSQTLRAKLFTNIQLKVETRDRLKEIGKKGESYDAIINRIIDELRAVSRL